MKFLLLVFLSALASTSAVIIVRSNDIDDSISDNENSFNDVADSPEVILGVSTLVNGVSAWEIPALLDRLTDLRVSIKSIAFEALSGAVKSRRRSLDETKRLIDGMKRVLLESLHGLSAVRAKVTSIQTRLAKSPPELAHALLPTEAFFLTNVRDSFDDILAFTRDQFNRLAHIL